MLVRGMTVTEAIFFIGDSWWVFEFVNEGRSGIKEGPMKKV